MWQIVTYVVIVVIAAICILATGGIDTSYKEPKK
jgi:hypothetical protein